MSNKDVHYAIEVVDIKKSFGSVEALRGVSMFAKPGEVTAIVGDNGAGKSTLIKGLSGVQPYDGGVVKFNGEVVHIHDPRQAGGLGIEVVYQDLALCENLDIVQNMFLGREEIATGTLDEANMEYQAAMALQSLSVKTVKSVRQKVSSLSGGQRQRIAIARAILKDPPIVLLDEATSALDAASERLVQTALNNAARNRTTLVIAHRLATVQQADRIVVLEQGRIVAQGRHAELLQRSPLYARLAALQFGGASMEAEGHGAPSELATGSTDRSH